MHGREAFPVLVDRTRRGVRQTWLRSRRPSPGAGLSADQQDDGLGDLPRDVTVARW